MNKKIITIAEIVFALIFVVLLAVFMATINSKGNAANTQLVNTLDSTGTTSTQSYNSTDVKGSTVTTALDNFKSIGGDNKITMVVTTTMGKAEHGTISSVTDDEPTWNSVTGTIAGKEGDQDAWGYLFGYDKNGKELPKYMASAEDAWYINPSANFHCELIYNKNDVVIGIWFVQDGGTD